MLVLNFYIMKLLDKINEVCFWKVDEMLRNKFRADWLKKTVEIDVGSINKITVTIKDFLKKQISQVSCFVCFAMTQ